MADLLTAPHSTLQVEASRRTLVVGRALHEPWNEGTRVINRNFARATATRHDVRLISLTQQQFRLAAAADPHTTVPVEHVYSPAGYTLMGIYRGLPLLVRQLGNGAVDVAHLFGMPLALAPRLRQLGARVVVHVMTSSSGPTARLLNGASWVLFDRWVDAYAVSSPILVPALLQRGVHPAKVAVVPPAIDTTVYQPGDRLAARQRLGLAPDELLVLYLGRLSPNRFPAAVVARALREVAEAIPRPLRFVALSPGQTYDGSENTSKYLLACTRAAAADMRDLDGANVDIRFGDLTEAEKVLWLQAADAVLLPFAHPESVEPPLTLLEALACGATIIVTSQANRSAVVRDGHNGYLYQGAQLGAQLCKVFRQPEAQTTVAEHGRATVLSEYSFAATADATERLWRNVGERTAHRGLRAGW